MKRMKEILLEINKEKIKEYNGYKYNQNSFDGLFYIYKGKKYIGRAKTEEEVKKLIDNLSKIK